MKYRISDPGMLPVDVEGEKLQYVISAIEGYLGTSVKAEVGSGRVEFLFMCEFYPTHSKEVYAFLRGWTMRASFS